MAGGHEVVDGDRQRLGEGGQEVRGRPIGLDLLVGDHSLGDADLLAERGLAEAARLAQSGPWAFPSEGENAHSRALGWAWSACGRNDVIYRFAGISTSFSQSYGAINLHRISGGDPSASESPIGSEHAEPEGSAYDFVMTRYQVLAWREEGNGGWPIARRWRGCTGLAQRTGARWPISRRPPRSCVTTSPRSAGVCPSALPCDWSRPRCPTVTSAVESLDLSPPWPALGGPPRRQFGRAREHFLRRG